MGHFIFGYDNSTCGVENILRMRIYVWLMVACTVSSSISDAQKISADQTCTVVSETTVYEIVKNILLTKFVSINGEIRGAQYPQIPSDSGSRLISDLKERVSRLEDEMQTIKGNLSTKENSEMKSLVKRTQELNQHVENLGSRMNATLQETGSVVTISNTFTNERIANISAQIMKLQTTVDESELKFELLQRSQQNYTNQLNKLHSKIAETGQGTETLISVSNNLTNEQINNATAELKLSLDGIERTIADVVKNASLEKLIIESEFETKLQEFKQDLLIYKKHVEVDLELSKNDSTYMIQQHKKTCSETVISYLENMTKSMESTRRDLNLVDLRINATIIQLEEKVDILERNNNILTDEITKAKMQTLTLKQNISETMDTSLSLINESLVMETATIKDNFKDIIQNVSILNKYSLMHFESEHIFNRSLEKLMNEIVIFKRDYEKARENTIQTCVEMVGRLEQSVDEKVFPLLINITERINLTSDEIKLEGFKVNRSIVLIEEKVKKLQSDKSSLEFSISEVENDIVNLKGNDANLSDNLNVWISGLATNMSAIEYQIKTNQLDFAMKITRNISEMNANHLLLLNALSTETSAIKLNTDGLKRNMSLLQNKLETTYRAQLERCILNLTSDLKDTQDRLRQSQIQQLEFNKTINDISEDLNVTNDEMKRILNRTKSEILQAKFQFQNFINDVNGNVQNHTIIRENFFDSVRQMVKANMSSYNGTLYRTVRLMEENITEKNKQLSFSIEQISGNISNLSRKVNELQTSSNSQISRLPSIETRLLNLSTQLTILQSRFESFEHRSQSK